MASRLSTSTGPRPIGRAGPSWSSGSGTGNKLIPIASDGHPCTGLELSPDMLAEARRKADERGVDVEWVQGDMRRFDLGRMFDIVVIAANSLLHLHEADDLVDCFRSVRRHLAPGARLVLDVFNPSVHMLAQADGVRRRRDALSFTWTPTVAWCRSMSRRRTTRPRR